MYEAEYLKNKNRKFVHLRIDQLFSPTGIAGQELGPIYTPAITADKGATYAKHLCLDFSILSPYVSGPNSVKVATPLAELQAQDMQINKAYLVLCTNSRASDFAAAAKVFKDAAAANNGKVYRILSHVKFYIAAASLPEQRAAEEQGDWQALLAAGAEPLPSASSGTGDGAIAG